MPYIVTEERLQDNKMGISAKEYQSLTGSTAVYPTDPKILALAYCALGLTNEAGEAAGKIKKAIRDSNSNISDETLLAIEAELGDVMWYASQLCNELGLNLEDIFEHNIEKLTGRKARGTIGGSGDYR